MSSFGSFMREKRQSKNPKISLRELGRRTNVDASYISRIEKGEYTPSRQVVISIAEALYEDGNEFLIKAGYVPKNNEYFYVETKEIMQLLIDKGVVEKDKKITPDKLRWIIELLDKAIDMSRMKE